MRYKTLPKNNDEIQFFVFLYIHDIFVSESIQSI